MRTLCWSLANLAASILAVNKRYKLDWEKKSARGVRKPGGSPSFDVLMGFSWVCVKFFFTATILSTEEGDEGDGV